MLSFADKASPSVAVTDNVHAVWDSKQVFHCTPTHFRLEEFVTFEDSICRCYPPVSTVTSHLAESLYERMNAVDLYTLHRYQEPRSPTSRRRHVILFQPPYASFPVTASFHSRHIGGTKSVAARLRLAAHSSGLFVPS